MIEERRKKPQGKNIMSAFATQGGHNNKSTHSLIRRGTTTENKHRKLKPGLVASYDIQPGNREGLFWFRRFINLSLTYLLRHLLTYLQPRTHTGQVSAREENEDEMSK